MRGRLAVLIVSLLLMTPTAAWAQGAADQYQRPSMQELLATHRSAPSPEAMDVGDFEDARDDVLLTWHEEGGDRQEVGAFDNDIATMRVDYDDPGRVALEVTMHDLPADQWSVTIWHLDIDDDGVPDYELDHVAQDNTTQLFSVDDWLVDEPVEVPCEGVTASHSPADGSSTVALPADCLTSPDAVAVHVLTYFASEAVTALDALPDGLVGLSPPVAGSEPEPSTPPTTDPEPTDPQPTDELPDRTAQARPIGSDTCPFATGRFPDVPSGSVHRVAVSCIAGWEVSEGFNDGTYRPRGDVSRAQMASFIARTLRHTDADLPAGTNAFPDDGDSTHEDNINALAAAGVVQGFGDGAYRPSQPVTRAQMASFITRAIGLILDVDADGNYFDDDDGHDHEANINGIATYGITTGVVGRQYAPSATVSRDQMASFIARTLDLLVDGGQAVPPDPPPPPRPACDPSYPDFCIPPPPPSLTCDDVDETNFRVTGDDPHGFDGDGDGVGCEG